MMTLNFQVDTDSARRLSRPIDANNLNHVAAETTALGRITWQQAGQAPLSSLSIVPNAAPLLSHPGALLIAKAVVAAGGAEFCIKMRYPLSDHQKELDTYLSMINHGGVHKAFVPVLYAFEFEFAGPLDGQKKVWGALVMPFVDTTLCHILSVSPRPSAPVELQRLSTAFFQHSLLVASKTTSSSSSIDEEHGIPLLPPSCNVQQEGFEMAVLAVCFRLLMLLHKNGWIHGDTHLGNFMLDSKTWRVYLIDTERSFPTADPVQYLLDAQELFGHATGLLLSLQNRCNWDMADVWAVMSRMHPATGEGGPPLAGFMPVCTCFVNELQCDRLRGCRLCKSKINTAQASLYLDQGHRWWQQSSQRMLETVSYDIKLCREDCHDEVEEIASALTQQVSTIHRWLLRQQQLNRKPDNEHLMFLQLLSSRNGSSKLRSWLNFVLYNGAMLKRGASRATNIAKLLSACSLPELSRKFLSLVSVYPPMMSTAVLPPAAIVAGTAAA